MAKYILSSFADEYSDNLVEQCEGMKSLGIEYIEIRHANGKAINEMSYDDLKENKKVMDYYGIKTNSVGSPLGKIKIDDDIFSGNTTCQIETNGTKLDTNSTKK